MTSNFPPTSRYALTPTTSLVRADGSMVTYLKRRFVPAPENFALLQWHRVVQGERLDNIAAQYLGDPEQFWRLCDLNLVRRPVDLTAEPGAAVAAPSPEGGN